MNRFWQIIVILTMCAVFLASFNIIELEKRINSLTQIVSIMETRIDALESYEGTVEIEVAHTYNYNTRKDEYKVIGVKED